MSLTSPFRRFTRCRPFAAPSPRGSVSPVVEVVGAALATAGLYAVAVRLDYLPHPGFQLLAVPAGAVLLPLRRRLPGAVLLVLAVLTGTLPCLGPVTAATAYSVARRTVRARRRARLLGAAGLLCVLSATAVAPWFGPGSVPYGVALGLVLAVTAVVVPGLVGTAYGQQGRLVRALRERGDAAERARRLADSEARVQERSRIAAEMHDMVGHRLSLVSLYAGGLELALDRAHPELREEAVLVRHTTQDAMRELRQALGVLGPLGRDTGPDALTDATGTRAGIEALVAESRDGGIAVQLDWRGADLGNRSERVRRAVHRVVREALTNVHRYATAAHVTVRVVHGDETVRVTVRNGAPPKPSAPAEDMGTGRGLAGLRERVELLGGNFDAAALPSGGFQVEAVVPTEPGEIVAAERPGTGPASTGPTADTASSGGADRVGRQDSVQLGRRTAEALTLAFGMVALCVLMVLGIGFVFVGHPRGTGPPPLPHIGMSFQDMARDGVVDNLAVRAAATGREPSRPAGTVGCVYPFNGATESRPDGLVVARYCFDTAHRLIAIDRFTVPLVRDAAPWEIAP
ncbi:sensor histidine kinase [Streptomyces silvisoli]|uniref:histidine kinase n=1 Tax=Streptomyces silvisoli TaxID=3034235 RepID=A0ABT5ZLI7_9ACTN|nr:histidine kinase [Streptomyces silvisoli]MDF3289853.1 histidine kinase [Streptomyces silvisoli]